MSLDSRRLRCISAAPAALDRYLAALPAMSLIPFAPFASTALTFELVIVSDAALESFRDLVKSPRLASSGPVPQRAQD